MPPSEPSCLWFGLAYHGETPAMSSGSRDNEPNRSPRWVCPSQRQRAGGGSRPGGRRLDALPEWRKPLKEISSFSPRTAHEGSDPAPRKGDERLARLTAGVRDELGGREGVEFGGQRHWERRA